MNLSQVAQVVGGALHGEALPVSGVSIDTRTLKPGDLFVAISGERFDGHDFLAAAQQSGASAAVVSADAGPFDNYVQVADCRLAFGRIASALADNARACRLAVTGNAGKTTVKEMMACMLGEGTHATRGNFNNDIGVPLTLLALDPEAEYAVFELGANAPGEIAWTVSLVKPCVAMVTNVTGAHLEGFGSMQGIADAKAEIFSAVQAGGCAVINRDDSFADFFEQKAREAGVQVLTCSAREDADFHASDIEDTAGGVRFTLHAAGKQLPVNLALPGRHQVINALMAAAGVSAVGVDLQQAVARLAALAPVKGRMNVSACLGGTLVDDSYNANPGSVRVAADWLARQEMPRQFVLGELAELGTGGADILRDLGRDIAALGIEELVTVGTAAAAAADGFGGMARRVADHAEAAERARDVLVAGGTVLVKGSRSAGMEQVVEHLKAMGAND